MYSTSYSGGDGNKGVGFPPLVLYGVDYWVVFGVFVCEGLFSESIVIVCKFNELDLYLGDGGIGVCGWLRAPIMHMMYGLSLAWHWHIRCGHVHVRSHFGTIWSGGWLFRLPALVKVKNLVCLLACSV